MEKKLIAHIDCTKDYGSDSYFEIGKSQIVTTEAGTYREAEHFHLARFGYRFKLNDITKPHLVVIRYPDDKERFMCISNGTSYDLDTGVTSGGVNKTSGKMLEIENYYFPRWADDSIVFTSWGQNQPAAVSEIFVYEIDKFDVAELPKDCHNEGNRRMGIQYEDPCGVGESVGATDHTEFIENHIKYMKFSGTNHLTYPINWYHGPIVPVKCQPANRFMSICTEDRNRYMVARTKDINDWLEHWLERFDEEGLSFKGSMTLMRLGRLMENMNVDEDKVKAGADTYNNVLFNGAVQRSLNDWTTNYNPISFDNWIESYKGAERVFAYGEQKEYGDELSKEVRVPLFNPLHPVVQNQVIELLGELAERYAKHPSFKGLAINMWHGTMLWFGSLLAGYDDVSIGMFEKETGISLGIEPNDPRRFEKRFIKLSLTLRDAFVSWRCKKIHEFICRIRDAVVAKRADLTLTLTVWNETSASYGYFNSVPGATTGYGARSGFYEVYRDGGLDLKLYGDEKNIEIAVEKTHSRDQSENALTGEEFTNMFVDTAFLDNEIADVLNTSSNSTSFIFDSWVEMWGQLRKFECDKDDENLPGLKYFEFGEADHISRANSTYPDDKENRFWFESQRRITSAFPSGHYLEWLVNELAAHDALEITQGGLYLDTAHSKEQLEFAKEYRKLPKCKFNTVDGNFGVAVVRYLEKGGKTYVYALNREPYSVDVDIKTESDGFKWSLKPFELKVEIFEGKIVPNSYSAVVPADVEDGYIADAESALNDIEKSFNDGYFVAGAKELENRIKKAVEQKNYSFIRHAMKCQIMNTVRKVLGGI